MRWTVEAFRVKLLKVYIILHLLQLFFQEERFLQILQLSGYPEQATVVIRAPQTFIMILLTKNSWQC